MEVNVLTFLIVLALLLIVLIVVLFIIHKGLKKKVSLKQQEKKREDILREKVEDLKTSKQPIDALLDSVDSFARALFKELYNIEKKYDYSELAEIFNEKNKRKVALFSRQMLLALYSGSKIKKEKINSLLKILEEIIDEEYLKPKIVRAEIREPIIKKQEKPLLPQIRRAIIKPIKLSVMPVRIKTLPEIKETVVLDVEKQAELLSRVDESQIRAAYKELQRRFEQAYRIAEKTNNRKNLRQLDEFRDSVMRTINGYVKDRFKIIELAEEISKGARLLRITSNL